MTTLRRGEETDGDEIFGLLRRMHRECEMDLPRFSADRVMDQIDHAVRHAVVVLAEHDGELVGSIALEAMAPWYSDQKLLGDHWFYVRPERRSYEAARKLLMAARDIAKMNRMPLCLGVLYGPTDLERKDLLYRRCGLTRVGSFYVEGM